MFITSHATIQATYCNRLFSFFFFPVALQMQEFTHFQNTVAGCKARIALSQMMVSKHVPLQPGNMLSK